MKQTTRILLGLSIVLTSMVLVFALPDSVSGASCLAGSCDQTAELCGPSTGFNCNGTCIADSFDCGTEKACLTEGCDPVQDCTTLGCPAGEACNTSTGLCETIPAGCLSDPTLCDDGNPCTNDTCNADGSCSNPQNGNCTAPSPTPPPVCTTHEDCDDGVDCTVDICQITNCANFGGGCFCGDGSCTGNENTTNCAADCASATPSPSPSPPPLVNSASCVSHTIPTTMTTGQVLSVSVTMNNNGTTSWVSGGATPYSLGSSNPRDNTVWGPTRVSLPSTPIGSGNNATFTFNITAPSTAGTFSNQWEMIQETVEWFGALCGPTTVTVVAPPQCSDGLDNDSDGLIDWPADPGCVDANDNDEFNVPPNNPPQAPNVTVQEPDYCTVGPSVTVDWDFTDPDIGDTQSAFQVQVDDDPAFGSPAVDTGKIISSATSHFVGQGALSFNTVYRARVRVWDNHDQQCLVWQPQVGCQGPGCQPGNTSWRTPVHRYPSSVGIGVVPAAPQINEVAQFSGSGTCFDANNNPTSCLTWHWDFGDGGTATIQNPTHAYGSMGTFVVTLQVEDAQNFICPVVAASQTIQIKLRLPRWREVLPR